MKTPANRDYATSKVLQSVYLADGVLKWHSRSTSDFEDAGYAASWNARNEDKPVALKINAGGYVTFRFLGCWFFAHRVIWALHYGDWPVRDIDHINGNRTDNRLENLRDVSRAVNAKNAKMRHDNTSGETGVHLLRNKWIAAICEGGKNRHLGSFDKFDDAVAARRAAAEQRGYSPRHGKPLPDADQVERSSIWF